MHGFPLTPGRPFLFLSHDDWMAIYRGFEWRSLSEKLIAPEYWHRSKHTNVRIPHWQLFCGMANRKQAGYELLDLDLVEQHADAMVQVGVRQYEHLQHYATRLLLASQTLEEVCDMGRPLTASLGVLHERNAVGAKRIPSFWIDHKHCLDDCEMAKHGR
jgi:hypothetical protein